MGPGNGDNWKTSLSDWGIMVKYQLKIAGFLARTLAKRGPAHILRMKREMQRFSWFAEMGDNSEALKLFTQNRSGYYREAVLYLMVSMMEAMEESVYRILTMPERTIFQEEMIMPEIFHAMGLNPWNAEFLGILMPSYSQELSQHFIDVAESSGMPPDSCSLPKLTVGLVLDDQMPDPVAIVSSNMPCDSGMSSYSVMQKKFNVPAFRLDVPHNFHNKRALDYFVKELESMITWFEEHTPGKMDWDRMREICTERNRATEYEMELWDLIAQKPTPMAAEPVYFSHLGFVAGNPATPLSTKVFKNIVAFAKKISQSGQGALKQECFRMALWNPPVACYPELNVWAENTWGVANIMDMLTYHNHPYIDTKSPETMLKDLARIIMTGPMAQHTRGPSENFFGDLFHLYERFSIDMIWMAGHVGCKNTMALNGMFREKCRERDIPLLTINYDLMDSRIVSQEEIRKQINSFMETVMKAEPLTAL